MNRCVDYTAALSTSAHVYGIKNANNVPCCSTTTDNYSSSGSIDRFAAQPHAYQRAPPTYGGQAAAAAACGGGGAYLSSLDANVEFYERAADRRRASLQHNVFPPPPPARVSAMASTVGDCYQNAQFWHDVPYAASGGYNNNRNVMVVAASTDALFHDVVNPHSYGPHVHHAPFTARNTSVARGAMMHRRSQPSLLAPVARPNELCQQLRPQQPQAPQLHQAQQPRQMRHAPSQPNIIVMSGAAVASPRRLPSLAAIAANAPSVSTASGGIGARRSPSGGRHFEKRGSGPEFNRAPNPVSHHHRSHQPRVLKRSPHSDLSHRFTQFQRFAAATAAGNLADYGAEGSNGCGSGDGGLASTPNADETEKKAIETYLLLKEAAKLYGRAPSSGCGGSASNSRRGSSLVNAAAAAAAVTTAQAHLPSNTPSPRNLSQASLHDSGYAEAATTSCGSRGQLMGSTPQLSDAAPRPNVSINGANSPTRTTGGGTAAAKIMAMRNGGGGAAAVSTSGGSACRPKLSEKMKSLSLDCAEMLPPLNAATMAASYKTDGRASIARGSADLSYDGAIAADYATSECGAVAETHSASPSRRLPAVPPLPTGAATVGCPAVPLLPAATGLKFPAVTTHVVIHEYVTQSPETSIFLGDRLHVLDNGDPDWLHGFRANDRLQQLISFPATCVAAVHPDEQPMRVVQNVHLVESKLRLYRDQVVFAQPDSIGDAGRTIVVRNEHGAMVNCPIQYLTLL